MDVFKTLAYIGDDATPSLIDTILIGASWWLVATWLLTPTQAVKSPGRIILMGQTSAKFQEVNKPGYRFQLVNSIPTSVLDGQSRDGYVVDDYSALFGNPGSSPLH